jgi:diacylglycerol kinase family enzyme
MERVSALLGEQFPDLVLRPTSGPREATAIAREAAVGGAPLVIAGGGDGTINETANGLAGTETALAILPFGTANVLAREIGVSTDPVRAAAMLPSMVSRRIALGRLDNAAGESRHFLLMAGAGLDAMVNQRVDPALKRRFGKLAYWVAGVGVYGQTLPSIQAYAEGREFTTGFALTARVRNYGGDLAIADSASLLRDQFQFVAFRGSSWHYPLYLGGAVFGRATSLPGVETVFTRRVDLSPLGGGRVQIQIDGEAAGEIPAVVELVPAALTLMLPERYARSRG